MQSAYLCDRQLQLNYILRLGNWRLKRCIQEQDAIQVFPASYCKVVHKKHLVHSRKVLTSYTATRFSWKNRTTNIIRFQGQKLEAKLL